MAAWCLLVCCGIGFADIHRYINIPSAWLRPGLRPGLASIRPADQADQADGGEYFTRFVYRPNWFVLEQTEGEEYKPATIPAWNEAKALELLGITKIPFCHNNGNVQGYAEGNSIAISPIAALPFKTMFHEMAHILLGHTGAGLVSDGEDIPRNIQEVEAEAVALICLESLGLDGAEFARGYI